MVPLLIMAATACLIVALAASGAADDLARPPVSFDPPELLTPPRIYAAPKELETEGVTALFYAGPPYKGKPTRIFAYCAVPSHKTSEKLPGIVLVHGGGGTAFPEWVRLWNRRGYAAIAMDTVGALPNGQRHDFHGPNGYDAGFTRLDDPIEDQWGYHAVAAVMLANSYLRSIADVDPDRIGLTGISWGGYLACIAAGADPRFKFAVPVYGCGYLGENSAWTSALEGLGDAGRKWLDLWDPSRYLPFVRMPMLWVSGTNDAAYPLESLRRSYRLPRTPRTLCIRVRMPHGHGGLAENAEEIHAFANHLVNGGPALASITDQGRRGRTAWAAYMSSAPIVRAELNFTRDRGVWLRRWETAGARVDAAQHRASAVLPAGATAYYFNLVDECGLIVSTEHVNLGNSEQDPGRR
jgi:dienelactone hydrolase